MLEFLRPFWGMPQFSMIWTIRSPRFAKHGFFHRCFDSKYLTCGCVNFIIISSEEAVFRMITVSELMVKGKVEVGGAFSALSTGHSVTKYRAYLGRQATCWFSSLRRYQNFGDTCIHGQSINSGRCVKCRRCTQQDNPCLAVLGLLHYCHKNNVQQ